MSDPSPLLPPNPKPTSNQDQKEHFLTKRTWIWKLELKIGVKLRLEEEMLGATTTNAPSRYVGERSLEEDVGASEVAE